MTHKRKSRRGSKNPNAVLDIVQVETIRKLYKEKSYSQIALGITFNVSQSTISRIVSGQRWNNIL